VGVQEVRLDKGGTERAEDYTFFYGAGNEDHQLGTGFFVHKIIIPVARKVEFVCDRMSYIILRGLWCNIIVVNVLAPCEDTSDDIKDSFYEELGRVFDQFTRYDMKILLGDFNAKVGREDIFKPTIGNENSQEISNNNGVRVINYATSKNLVAKSTMFLHHSIHKYSWTSPDGKTQNQIDHILIDRRRHSSILDVRSLRGANFDSDHYSVVAKVRERLAVGKQLVKKMDVERFNLKQLNEEEVKEQYHVTIKNTFAALENLDDNGDFNKAWEKIRENKNIVQREYRTL
jgi:exonuclease III